MLLIIRTVLSSLPLVALPALAAEHEIPTGITGVGPSMFVFTIAAALLLTLVFRASASHGASFVALRLGRLRVRRALTSRCRAVLNDIILPGAYGGLAKIDHAVLTPNAIICIRAVHCHGRISGSDVDAQWTNIDSGVLRRFLNPLIQNEGRTRALRKLLPEVPVASLVIVTGAVQFSTPPPSNVIFAERLGTYLEKHHSQPDPRTDWDVAWERLESKVLHDSDARKDFAAQISFG